MRRWFNFTVILLFGVYGIYLYVTNSLTLYINPRYLVFSFVTSVVCLLIGAVGLISLLLENSSKLRKPELSKQNAPLGGIIIAFLIGYFVSWSLAILVIILMIVMWQAFSLKRSHLGYFVIAFTLGVAFLLPPAPLSSLAAGNSQPDFTALNLNTNDNFIQRFAGDSNKYNIGDWVRALFINPDLNSYVGKQVNVTGFVFKPDDIPDGYFMVSRFAITCCVVDARPLGLVTKFNLETSSLRSNDWVEVNGIFEVENINGEDQLVIIVDAEPKKIEIPTDPYIY